MNPFTAALKNSRGSVLAIVVILMVILMIMVPALVQWGRNESKAVVREQKKTQALNLADAGVDRAVWKLKSSTATWKAAADGIVITGYNFDQAYTDVEGGVYRIKISSGPASGQVTVLSEGRDRQNREKRSLQVVFKNTAFPAALLTGGVLQHSGAFEVHWGPVMAQNNIVISGNAATEYFPRKFSKQVVIGTGGQPRDTNGINPPNTDNVEWWSDYSVPDLPQLDFATMRSSASTNGTLNYYTTGGSSGSGKCIGWSGHGRCESGTNSWANHAGKPHFFDTNDHTKSKNGLIWYWDGDVIVSGNMTSGCHRGGLVGTVVVRGNMSMDSGDCYAFTGTVPAEAWKEYTRLKTSQYDTATSNQYPADTGYQSNALTFDHGSDTWTGGPPSANTDVGYKGLIYVGGDLTINSISDVNGVVWVAGNVINNTTGERVLIFYDDGLDVPVLNVVLSRVSWQEASPSSLTTTGW